MDKLLKHFGLGSKKGPAQQHCKSDYGSQNVDSIQDLDVKSLNYGTERMVVDGRDHDIQRSNSEYARTLPTSSEFRSPNLSREHNWSLHRGRITRQPVHSLSLKEKETSVKSLYEGEERNPGQTFSKEESSTVAVANTREKAVGTIPLSDDYSDPYDLKKVSNHVSAPVQEPEEASVIIPADQHENDYSVPYELRTRSKADSSVKEKEEQPVSGKAPVEYDDPYEESPLIPIALSSASVFKCQQQQQLQQQQQQQQQHQELYCPVDRGKGDNSNRKSACTQTCGVVEDLSKKNFEPKERKIEECITKVEQVKAVDSTAVARSEAPPVSTKFYQLSAEYGGIGNEDDEDDVGNYTDLQPECITEECLAKADDACLGNMMMLPPVARHARVVAPPGTYEEPWDLSMIQKGLEDRLSAAHSHGSKKQPGDIMSMSSLTIEEMQPRDGLMSRSCHVDVMRQDGDGRIVCNETRRMNGPKNSEPSAFPVYGVPWSTRSKEGRREMNSSRTQINAGNCAPLTHSLGVGKVSVPVRSSSLRPVDSRPLEDYDEPWDQKKKAICKTASDANSRSVSLTNTHPTHHVTNATFCSSWSSTLAEQIDTNLPLEKQTWYHGNISRVEAENLLRVHREGSYLIRNSESNKRDYSLSVKSAHGFMHMKIVVNAEGRFVLGQFSQPFGNIAQMILHYTIHKLPIKGAEHMSLIFPVPNKLL